MLCLRNTTQQAKQGNLELGDGKEDGDDGWQL